MKEILSPSELAAYLHVSISSLDRMRGNGEGPPFVKIGKRRVGYMWNSVQAWLDARQRTSTRELVDQPDIDAAREAAWGKD